MESEFSLIERVLVLHNLHEIIKYFKAANMTMEQFINISHTQVSWI